MEIETFKQKLKSCKKGEGYGYDNLKVYKFSPVKFKIIEEKKAYVCSKCSTKFGIDNNEIDVIFINSHELTVFETEMLFDVFVKNKIPLDMGGFPDCIAGKRFIENIKEIR